MKLSNLFNNPQRLFSKTPHIRLAVVGATATGKTYLLTDIVGALERLGYKRDDSCQQSALHPDLYDLIANQEDDGGIAKTPVTARRLDSIYMSHFLTPHHQRVRLDVADISGETATPEAIHVFKGVMRAMVSNRTPIFQTTTWKHPDTREEVRILEAGGDMAGRGTNQLDGLDGAIRNTVSHGQTSERFPQTAAYMPTSSRKAYYSRLGFVAGESQEISGAKVFKDFLLYDTDTLLNAITTAWGSLGVDTLLNKSMLNGSSGKMVFQNVVKNHFFHLYYIFNATDVVVCDLCCTPSEAGDMPIGDDHFTEMMRELRDLTSFNDTPAKNWYLALKGFDAVMRQEPFAEVFRLAAGDLNLTYSHFLALFRQACIHHLLPGSEHGGQSYRTPFSSQETMMDWLTSDGRLLDNEGLANLLANHYEQLDTIAPDLFASPAEYAMRTSDTLDEHVARRCKDFCMIDDRIADSVRASDEEQTLLRLPQSVFLTATPIDDDFHIRRHRPDSPKAFDEPIRHYNRRAHFGSLQLTTSILLNHGLDIADDYNNYGLVLSHALATNA
ncbi:MAG: hypothetical protein J5529_12950 [Prevotella sp.]|nr:hypothetical protein [Prevotella sp.]